MHRFTCVYHTRYLAIARLVAARRAGPSRFPPRTHTRASVHCRSRSLFRLLGSPGGTGGFVSSIERNNFILKATSCRSNAQQVSEREPRCLRFPFRSTARVGRPTDTLRYLYAPSPPRLLQFYSEDLRMARSSRRRPGGPSRPGRDSLGPQAPSWLGRAPLCEAQMPVRAV